eukprot:g2696.t1
MGGRKSHVRFYMTLVKDKNGLKAYVDPEPLLFLACMPYAKCREYFARNEFGAKTSLCNQSNLTMGMNFFKKQLNLDNPKLAYQLFSSKARDAFDLKFHSGFYVEKIEPQIQRIADIIQLMLDHQDELCANASNPTFERCFQTIAVDVMFDDGKRTSDVPHAWVLEANMTPGFRGPQAIYNLGFGDFIASMMTQALGLEDELDMEESITNFSLLSEVEGDVPVAPVDLESIHVRLEACENAARANSNAIKRFKRLYKELEDSQENTVVKLETEIKAVAEQVCGLGQIDDETVKQTIAELGDKHLCLCETIEQLQSGHAKLSEAISAISGDGDVGSGGNAPPEEEALEHAPMPSLPAHLESQMATAEFQKTMELYPKEYWFRKYIKYKLLYAQSKRLPVVQRARCASAVEDEDSAAWSERLEATIEEPAGDDTDSSYYDQPTSGSAVHSVV